MRSRLCSVFVLAAQTLCAQEPASATPGGTKHTLRVATTKGAKGRFLVSNSSVMVLDLLGGREHGNEQVSELEAEVLDVSEAGEPTVRFTWKRVHGKASSMIGEFVYDSADPDGVGIDLTGAGMMIGLAGKSVEAVVAANGEIKEVKGLRQVADEIFKSLPGLAKTVMKVVNLEGAIKSDLDIFGYLPSAPVAIGGTWVRKDDMSASGDGTKMRTETALKLEEASAERYVISMSGKIESEPARAAGEGEGEGDKAGAPRYSGILRGKLDGRVTISRQDGMVESSVTSSTMDVETPNAKGGDNPPKMAMKMVMKIERVRGAAAGHESVQPEAKKDVAPGK